MEFKNLSFTEQDILKVSPKILIVDDSESDRGAYRRYLLADKNFEYQILEAETLEEGLELWRSQSPDLVLTDINLPDGSGLELLKEIEKTYPIQKFPVIMMTGQGDERLAVQAMKLGASDYLVKGDITAATLCRVVRQGMDKWTLSKQLMQLQQQLESQNSDLIKAVEALKVQKDFNQLIAEISSRFVKVNDETFDVEIDRSLQLIGEMIQVDTGYLFTLDRDRQTLSMSHEWSQPGSLRQIAIAQNIPFAAFPYSMSLILQQQYCCVSDTELLPPEAAVDAASWRPFNLKSLLSLPLTRNGTTIGILGLASFSRAIAWDEEIIRVLTVLSQTIANTQARITAENIRKQNELDLAQWRKRYELAEQVSGQMVYEYNFVTDSMIWGANAILILGYAEPDLPRHLSDWFPLIHPEDLSLFQQALETEITNKTPFFCQYRFLHQAGHYIWLEDCNQWLFDEQGEGIGVIGMIADISDQKEAELILRKQALVFENITDGVIITDMDGIIIDWNRGAENLYGYTKAEMLGKRPSIIHKPEEAQWLPTKIFQTTLQKGSWLGDIAVICKDGSKKITTTSTILLKDDQKNNIAVIGLNHEITKLKQTQEELRQSNEQLQQLNQALETRVQERTQELQASEAFNRSILETMPDLLLHLGRDGTCLNYIEPKVGKEHFQVMVNHIAEVLPPDLLARQLQAIEQALVTGKLQVYEHQLLKNGQGAYEEVRILPINDQEVLVIVRDISDRKQAEEVLNTERLRLKLALDAANMGTWSRSPESDQLIWSDWVQEIFGFVPGTFPGDHQTFVSMIHPEDRDRVIQAIAHTFATGEAYHLEYRIVRLSRKVQLNIRWSRYIMSKQCQPL